MVRLTKQLKSGFIFGFLILVVALFLRLYNLTYLPVFTDEAIYIRWAQVMRAEPTLRFLPLSDGKQPLFMWTIIPFLKIFSDPLFAGRLVSVLTGMGTLVGIFLLTYYLFQSKKAALVAGFIYAVSPYAVFFDRMALADSMLSMFGVWTLFLATITARTFFSDHGSFRFDFAILTGFALGGALLTKSPALFFVLLLPTVWFLVNWPSLRKGGVLKLLKAVSLLLVTYIIAYGMYNILRLGPNFHMIGLRNRDYVLPLDHILTNPKDPFIFHIDRALEWFWQLGPSVLVVFTLFSVIIGLKRFKKETLILLAWSLLPIFIQSMYAKSFTARYVLFSLPALIALGAMSFLINKEIFRRGLILGLIVFVFHAFYINQLLLTDIEAAPLPRVMRSGYLEEWTAGTGIKEVADYLRTQAKNLPAGRQVIVGTEGYFGTLPDGLQMYLNDLPEVTVIGVGIDFGEVPSQLLESAKAGNKTYFVVNSSRLRADPEKLGLKLIAAYPKAFRPDGIKEYVQFGPRDTFYLFEVNLPSPGKKAKR